MQTMSIMYYIHTYTLYTYILTTYVETDPHKQAHIMYFEN